MEGRRRNMELQTLSQEGDQVILDLRELSLFLACEM